MATIETLTKEQAVERGWEFGVGTVPDSGVINREVLWRETFDTAMKVSGTTRYSTYDDPGLSTGALTDFKPSTIESYNNVKDGCEVSDGNVSAIMYSGNNNTCISKYAASVLRGVMFGGYLWMRVGGVFSVSGIRNYGRKAQIKFKFAKNHIDAQLRLSIYVNSQTVVTRVVTVSTGATAFEYGFQVALEDGDLVDMTMELLSSSESTARFDNIIIEGA